MEIGPTRLESNRLTTLYTIVRGRKRSQNELIYKFEEEVFDPKSPMDINLAALVGAQVALNYGLFCKQMVFLDPFDRRDQKFLVDVLRMTAQEIFVIKFLHPNPFLKGQAASLPPIKQKSYLRAEVDFVQTWENRDKKESRLQSFSKRKAAVLSSGGKESLLSYGALKETGQEVHPFFVNESGRHWMTALNAYKHFSEHVLDTSRVWTNSDRIFSWMLRQFPFIRKDFFERRSDEYPIRLWTVAVFLFGVLPLVLKRGIGRIIIGDEYDTTCRKSFEGINHYGGLYDQSRHFDNTMSRFFNSKGWRLSLFSVVRPLSELLIENILSERYPELWRHQVSCHATHKVNDRVHPCGKCEKCRRVVGMLLAIGANPMTIGYDQKQISKCLHALENKGVHVEKPGAEHLAFLLSQAKLISNNKVGKIRGRERAEVMQLRFDSERSPANAIPVDLRKPLYQIFLKHAHGAVRKSGRLWNNFDLLKDKQLIQPYPFESPSDSRGIMSQWAFTPQQSEPIKKQRDYLLGDLSWPEALERFKQVDIALLPVGSVEQHGPHLPLDTDGFDAEHLSRSVAALCKAPRPLVLPLVPYGVSYHHADFSGTISVSPESLYRMIYDIGMSASRNGVTKLVIVNGHGGNAPALQFAAQMINRDAHVFTCVDTGETSDEDLLTLTETPGDVHAGEAETSTSLATRPNLVRLSKAESFVPKFSSRYLDFSSKRSVEWYTHTAKISPSGVMGDPTKASKEKGKKMWEIMIRNLVEFVEHLKGMSLDEIYQRRY
jgi:creatinine amidohydrolase/Fe(II)-dependent formamide hydrolase-like protein